MLLLGWWIGTKTVEAEQKRIKPLPKSAEQKRIKPLPKSSVEEGQTSNDLPR
jgi:hypothetical protein